MEDRLWRCRDHSLAVYRRTHVMGVLNVTPDSFSDGGRFFDHSAAVKRGVEMVSDGADIIDVGGESTRPGAEPVPEEEEIRRAIPVVEQLVKEVEVPVSIDTTKAAVALSAFEAGASILNDVSALRFDPDIVEAAIQAGAGIILMHMLGDPRTMQDAPHYDDVTGEVASFLGARASAAENLGVASEAIAVDPGIGFGKTVDHNLSLIKHLEEMVSELEYPVVIGTSRKSFIGKVLELEVEQRLEGTAATVAWAVASGAHVVRVHDVREMVRVVRVTEAISEAP